MKHSIGRWSKKQWLLYGAAGAVALFWVGFGLHTIAAQAIKQHAGTTSARLYDISSALQALPAPDSITASQTSGNADGVISEYSTLLQAIEDTKNTLAPPLWATILGYPAAKVPSAEVTAILNDYYSELEALTSALKASKKFIEYNPSADLAALTGTAEDAERLERTKAGIEKTLQDLRGTQYSQRSELNNVLVPLINAAPNVTPATIAEWENNVNNAQTTFINTYQKSYTSVVDSSKNNLQTYAEQYAKTYQ